MLLAKGRTGQNPDIASIGFWSKFCPLWPDSSKQKQTNLPTYLANNDAMMSRRNVGIDKAGKACELSTHAPITILWMGWTCTNKMGQSASKGIKD